MINDKQQTISNIEELRKQIKVDNCANYPKCKGKAKQEISGLKSTGYKIVAGHCSNCSCSAYGSPL